MTSSQQPVEFVALWSAHSKEIYAYIYSLVFNGPDADDIFQETSIILLQKFEEFEPGTNFNAWACRVAYHKVLQSHERRRLSELFDERLLEKLDDEAHRAAQRMESHIAALTDCLAKLSDKDRKLVQLRYEQGSTVETVAKKIGRTASLVYKSLSRIHDALLACIRRRLAEGDGQ